ncbi:MAG: hypothetical protein RLZZ341_1477, partial [Pseudomonadota bacterium]
MVKARAPHDAPNRAGKPGLFGRAARPVAPGAGT